MTERSHLREQVDSIDARLEHIRSEFFQDIDNAAIQRNPPRRGGKTYSVEPELSDSVEEAFRKKCIRNIRHVQACLSRRTGPLGPSQGGKVDSRAKLDEFEKQTLRLLTGTKSDSEAAVIRAVAEVCRRVRQSIDQLSLARRELTDDVIGKLVTREQERRAKATQSNSTKHRAHMNNKQNLGRKPGQNLSGSTKPPGFQNKNQIQQIAGGPAGGSAAKDEDPSMETDRNNLRNRLEEIQEAFDKVLQDFNTGTSHSVVGKSSTEVPQRSDIIRNPADQSRLDSFPVLNIVSRLMAYMEEACMLALQWINADEAEFAKPVLPKPTEQEAVQNPNRTEQKNRGKNPVNVKNNNQRSEINRNLDVALRSNQPKNVMIIEGASKMMPETKPNQSPKNDISKAPVNTTVVLKETKSKDAVPKVSVTKDVKVKEVIPKKPPGLISEVNTKRESTLKPAATKRGSIEQDNTSRGNKQKAPTQSKVSPERVAPTIGAVPDTKPAAFSNETIHKPSAPATVPNSKFKSKQDPDASRFFIADSGKGENKFDPVTSSRKIKISGSVGSKYTQREEVESFSGNSTLDSHLDFKHETQQHERISNVGIKNDKNWDQNKSNEDRAIRDGRISQTRSRSESYITQNSELQSEIRSEVGKENRKQEEAQSDSSVWRVPRQTVMQLKQNMRRARVAMQNNQRNITRLNEELDRLDLEAEHRKQLRRCKLEEKNRKQDLIEFLDVGLRTTATIKNKKNSDTRTALKRARLLREIQTIDDELGEIEQDIDELDTNLRVKGDQRLIAMDHDDELCTRYERLATQLEQAMSETKKERIEDDEVKQWSNESARNEINATADAHNERRGGKMTVRFRSASFTHEPIEEDEYDGREEAVRSRRRSLSKIPLRLQTPRGHDIPLEGSDRKPLQRVLPSITGSTNLAKSKSTPKNSPRTAPNLEAPLNSARSSQSTKDTFLADELSPTGREKLKQANERNLSQRFSSLSPVRKPNALRRIGTSSLYPELQRSELLPARAEVKNTRLSTTDDPLSNSWPTRLALDINDEDDGERSFWSGRDCATSVDSSQEIKLSRSLRQKIRSRQAERRLGSP